MLLELSRPLKVKRSKFEFSPTFFIYMNSNVQILPLFFDVNKIITNAWTLVEKAKMFLKSYTTMIVSTWDHLQAQW